MQKRVEWVDLAKGIAIICVVIGHAGNTLISNYVYMFHLSVFIFLSGYFYNDEVALHPIKSFPWKFLRLYCMYFIYEIIFLLIRPLLFKIGWYQVGASYSGNTVVPLNISGTVKEAVKICIGMGREPLIGAMWFVIMLIMIQIIYIFIKIVVHRLTIQRIDTICVLVLFVIACLAARMGIYIPRLSPALLGLIFYHLGAEYRQKRNQNLLKQKNYYIAIMFCLILLVGSMILPIGYSEKVSIYPIWFLFTSSIGIFCVVILAQYLENRGGYQH